MRRLVFLAATAAILLFPASAFCQDQNQQQNQHAAQPPPPTELEKQKDSAPPSKPPVEAHGQVPAPEQKESLADAARRAREQKREASKSARTFDNDTLPAAGVSTVGQSPASSEAASGPPDAAIAAAPAPNDEKTWRARFSKLRDKLQRDQQDLEVMQRELGVLDVQHYDDPMKALQQQYTRSDINKKTAAIDAKKKEIEADNQAISDAEDELRKSGGDSGWAR
jgi:hypothetical protein